MGSAPIAVCAYMTATAVSATVSVLRTARNAGRRREVDLSPDVLQAPLRGQAPSLPSLLRVAGMSEMDPMTLSAFERQLLQENRALREEVRAIRVRPIPNSDDPGLQIFQALMEDARDRGEVRLEVRIIEDVEIAWRAGPTP